MTKHVDYLGDIPNDLLTMFSRLECDLFNSFVRLQELDDMIDASIRSDVAISLLDIYDAVEICSLPDMVPSQKAEWCWHTYNRYFKQLANIIIKAAKENQINNQLEYLCAKFKYESDRRKSVINKGGSSEYNKIKNNLSDDLNKLDFIKESKKILSIKI